MHSRYFRVAICYPLLGLWVGDAIRYDPTSPFPVTVLRHLPPNHCAVLDAIEQGALQPVSGDVRFPGEPPAQSESSAPPTLRVVR